MILRPEAAADEWRDDADLAFVEAEHAASPLRTNTGACVVSQIVIWLARYPIARRRRGFRSATRCHARRESDA